MATFPWFPLMTALGKEHRVAGLKQEGPGYQLLDLQPADRVALVLSRSHAMASTWEQVLAPKLEDASCWSEAYGPDDYWVCLFQKQHQPLAVEDIPQRTDFMAPRELMRLAYALKAMPECHWGKALYWPREQLCLPTRRDPESPSQRRDLVTALLTGGIADGSLSPQEILRFNDWLNVQDVTSIMQVLGIGQTVAEGSRQVLPASPFRLPGQARLEAFFNEYIVDYYRRKEAYDAMQISPPNGVLLYGPPGSGKTYAVRQLAEYLDWPVREIDLGSVGSTYIHQTSLRLRQEFEQAARDAPSMIIMDELDAMGANRQNVRDDHKIEEVSELLRLIDSAGQRNVIVFGMTNRPEALDSALRRRGRFDFMLEVGYAGQQAVAEMLANELDKRPSEPGIALEGLAARLTDRPLSDVAWVINEAGRLAVRSQRSSIDQWCLEQAVTALTAGEEVRHATLDSERQGSIQ
ncbi:AAA family ATPase [Halomonas sp. ML-15]|uniref:AAA family ATPase n=1 Tax=Halomonas sp. ML-15 TaxID=2773305 RepID=UPI0017463F55|nr:ATP-binding protein [Halomonas sp. ML-15]MBD3897782.1 AAA family ATPase [Halomonas sp. ML-15]